MTRQNNDVARYERYKRVVAVLLDHTEFSLVEMKSACSWERPAYVTQLVSQLVKDGFLEKFGTKTKPSFRWTVDRAQFAMDHWIDAKIFAARIKRTPLEDRPRERLLAHGAAQLRTAELIAILVRSGLPGESAVQAGERLAARFANRLERLSDGGRGELKAVSPAIDQTAYCQIMAGIELGRRVAAVSEKSPQAKWRIRDPEDAIAYSRETFHRLASDGKQEAFHVVTLDTKNSVIANHCVSTGSLNRSMAAPREIFRPAIKDNAATVILVHNHPSGDPTPSPEDVTVTKNLEEAGKKLGIPVLDHIVVGRGGAMSLRQHRARIST